MKIQHLRIPIIRLKSSLQQVPLTSVAINSGNSGDGATDPGSSPLNKEKEPLPIPDLAT